VFDTFTLMVVRGVTLSYLRPGEGLGVRCLGCRRERILTKDALIRLAGAHAELERLHGRLRCSSCGGGPADVWITLPNAYGQKLRA